MIQTFKMEEVVHLDRIPARILHYIISGEECYVPLHWHKDIALMTQSLIGSKLYICYTDEGMTATAG